MLESIGVLYFTGSKVVSISVSTNRLLFYIGYPLNIRNLCSKLVMSIYYLIRVFDSTPMEKYIT